MNRFLITCQGAKARASQARTYDRTESLWLHGPKKNIELKIESLERKVVENLSPACLDLLEIAAFCYIADTTATRGRVDATGERWYRSFDILIPVREPDRWVPVAEELSGLLTFLTGDRQIRLVFCPGAAHGVAQSYLHFPHEAPGFGGADECVLFSGGLDSLAGAISELESGKTPVLVSHRSHPSRVSAQLNLARQLALRWKRHVPLLSVWCRPIGLERGDTNQRMRAFLYLSLGIVVAAQLGIDSIKFCENGINTFHIPLSEQRVGSRSTRTTHPRLLRSLAEIAAKVFQKPISIENPLGFATKSDVVSIISKHNCQDLISSSLSCTRTTGMKREKPHCGTCYQCMMRRFATVDQSLENFDPAQSYVTDIFVDGLGDGEEKANALDWVRMHQRVRGLNLESFYGEFPELLDTLSHVPLTTDVVGDSVYQLYQRSSEIVERVLEKQFARHARDHIRGAVHTESLLGLLGRFEHLVEPIHKYIVLVGSILERGLRKTFSGKQPKAERELQRVCDGLLAAAGERLVRESPTFAYSVVHARPDFSRKDNRLYIEVKFIKANTRTDRIIAEMNNDVLQYQSQGAAVLFVVYQTASLIGDIEQFSEPFVRHKGVFVRVVP